MKVNEENVLKEMKNILSIMQDGYQYSKSDTCDRYLSKAIGKLGTLVSILSVAEDD